MLHPTKKQWAIMFANMLVIPVAIHVLRTQGVTYWIAFTIWAAGLRVAGFVEGRESR